jgi:AraC family transcriptional regulator
MPCQSSYSLSSGRVAGLRYTSPYGPALSEFWPATFLLWLQARQLDGPTCYGIGLDDPASTPASVVPLPGGRYAVRHFHGHARDIGAAWVELCTQLIPQQGWQHDARPSFERYPPGSHRDPESGWFSCEPCVAVR